MKAPILIRIITGLTSFLLAVFGLATLGSFFPNIPVLGIVGPKLTSSFGLWTVLLTLIGAIWAFWRWRGNRKRRTLMVAALALFATIGMFAVHSRQISVAQANGAQISLKQALFEHAQADPILEARNRHLRQAWHTRSPDRHLSPEGPDRWENSARLYLYPRRWLGRGNAEAAEADYRWLVERGYLVLSFEYPLSSEKQATWNVTHPLLGCALVWANANAARYGGDASRLALWGESAGGNLVLNVAYMANAGTLKPACSGPLPIIRATAALYPVIDAARMYHNPDPIAGSFARMMTTRYTGGTPIQFPDRYAAINPTTHITAKAPPTLLIIPQSDHLLEQAAAYAFEEKARAEGVKTRLIRMPYAEHSFDRQKR